MSNFEQARIDMIEGQLRTSGVLDATVLRAFANVPRQEFLSDSQKGFAYLDRDHKLAGAAKRYMGNPAAVAKLIELAAITSDDIVLDVACGTGYSTAIIARLANSVVAVEVNSELVDQANEVLTQLDISNAAVVKGPLAKGVPSEAPFDIILIQGAIGEVPKSLFDQLRVGGRLVALIGAGNSATAVLHIKNKTGIARVPSFNACLPELEEFAGKPEFAL